MVVSHSFELCVTFFLTFIDLEFQNSQRSEHNSLFLKNRKKVTTEKDKSTNPLTSSVAQIKVKARIAMLSGLQ